ncbi:GDSL esterase/lipase At5g03980-like [Coffea arabica]|uniref:GDSL esterase/lipase At5g03980-like n=1 Tax=Coffea arabica TaxID=13443 RepID=A0A6P6XGL8_COFAR|nr:acetylajmalan esterase-like isoform X1 [Coffea arabica]
MISSVKFSFLIVFSFLCTVSSAKENTGPFKIIYQFGDSLADRGNRIRQSGVTSVFNVSSLPYGMTYFHKPTGRFSNGLLVIDYIAKALHLPLLHPYLETNASFISGVNFAVGGSTALDNSFFYERNISVPSTNVPLSQQLKWFKKHLKLVSDNRSQCEERLKRALFMMGEIGGNDFSTAFSQGKSIKESRTYVPYVVDAISIAIREVIQFGARIIIVPGIIPMGCLPSFLTSFPSADPKAYDDKGCLKKLNKFVLFYNNYLQKNLAALRLEFPGVVIRYYDYYNAFQYILHNAGSLGFDQRSLLKACCGKGGKYNYSNDMICASNGVKACLQPERFVHWDGVHLTQEAYRYISDHLIRDILSNM